MVKTLTRHGNSYALVTDRAILDLLNITPDTPLDVSTDGTTLAADPNRRARLDAALDRTSRHYGRALKKLPKYTPMMPDFLELGDVLYIHADQQRLLPYAPFSSWSNDRLRGSIHGLFPTKTPNRKARKTNNAEPKTAIVLRLSIMRYPATLLDSFMVW